MTGPRSVKAFVIFALSVGLGAVSLLHAAAPVEERYGGSQSRSSSGSPQVADLYYQVQQLQQEIMLLRGQLEEQSYRIRKLEKQRLEDYQNIDKRLQQSRRSASSKAPASTAKSASKVAPGSSKTTAARAKPAQTTTSASERNDYQHAFQLLKKQELQQAQVAFEDFLRDYPNGQYSSNAYYWLGELYLTNENLPKARETFTTLVERYPDFRKTPDSSFKLAKIYHQLGDDKKSRAMLDKIVVDYRDSSPSTVKLANAYLDRYFR
jgi:tol-pal system protein YbgF